MHLSYFVKIMVIVYSWHISKNRYYCKVTVSHNIYRVCPSIQHIPKSFHIYLQWKCPFYFTRNSPTVKLKRNKDKKYALVLTYWHTSIVFYLKHRR